MKCLWPRVRNVRGVDVVIPCGKCIACRVNRTREWTTRLLHESVSAHTSYFVTLTYDDELLGNPATDVCKRDIQLFFKRLRKLYPDENIRYFVGSEYGPQTRRPHYHAIIFNLPDDILNPCKGWIKGMPLQKCIKGHQSYINRKINDIWQLGYCTIGELTPSRVSYCAKYFVNKIDVDEGFSPNFSLMSRRPGIGALYSEQVSQKVRAFSMHGVLTYTGNYVPIPRYYDKKIYSDEERASRLNDYPPELVEDVRGSLGNSEFETLKKRVRMEKIAIDMLHHNQPLRKL